MPGAAGSKSGSKPERDRLCREMLARGCTLDQVAEEMMRRWSFRPRQAWRYAHRMTQEDVAARYNELTNDAGAKMTGKRISDYESWPPHGIRPGPNVLDILAHIYGTRPEKLIDYQDLQAMPPREAALRPTYPSIRDRNRVNFPTLVEIEILEAYAMRRRALLAGLSAEVVSPALLSESLRQGLMSTLGTPAVVDDWHEIADEYGRRFMNSGFDVLNQQLAGDLLCLRPALDGSHLSAVAAKLSTVFGMTVANTGDPNGALRWYRTATALADESGDTATRVWVRGRGALTMGYEGVSRTRVIKLANQAVALSPTRPSTGLLEALIALAQAYASVGQKTEAMQSLNAAFDIFPTVEAKDSSTIYAMPAWRMAMSASLVYSRLGDTKRATNAQESGKLPPGMTGFRWHIEMHRAILQHDPGYAQSVLDAVPSGRISLPVRKLAQEAGLRLRG